MKRYKASYRKRGANPFAPVELRKGDLIPKTAEFPDHTPISKVERLAKQATPEGYEFIKVELVNKKRRKK